MQINDFYREVLHLTDEKLIQKLEAVAETRCLKKREIIVRAGEMQTHVVFMVSGIVRGFFRDAKGRDVTECFVYEPGTCAMSCLALDAPSPITIEALTECELLLIPIPAVVELQEEHCDVLRLYNRLLWDALQKHWEIKMVLYQYPARQRYQWFLEKYPGVAEQVSNKYIATYLGMTDVTMSRLRKAMREEAEAR